MRAAIQFSGGKDSLAVLYLMRDKLDGVTVYFGDTGHAYPHMLSFVQETCGKLGARLKIIRPPVSIDHYHAAFGLPADIVPVEASIAMRPYIKETKPLIQASLLCCSMMLWQPLARALVEDGITDVYRGSKGADHHVGAADGSTENGITYHSPLWGWTDEQVFAYLKEQGAELPAHYSRVNTSFDCLYCTAFLNHPGAREKLEWTREMYPNAWGRLSRNLATIKGAIDEQVDAIADALGAA